MVHFILVGGVVLNVAQVVAVEVQEEMGICTVFTTASSDRKDFSSGPFRYAFRGAAAKQVAEFFVGLAQDLSLTEQVEK
jgi:hypothetical protein